MEEIKNQFKKMLKKISFFSVIMFITIVIVSSILIVIFQKAKAAAASSSSNYSNYTNLGDYVVKTDEAGAMPALNKEQLKTAVDKMYSGQTHDNYIDWLDYFIEMQDKYKVNSAFGICVAQWEHQGGTNWGSIPAESYNLFSIKDGSGGWMYYSGYKEAIIEGFGKLIAESSNYFAGGNYTVKKIRDHYDNDPNEQWAEKIEKELDSFYAAAGVATNTTGGTYSGETFTFGNKTYTLFNQGDFNDYFGNGSTIAYAGCGATSIAICVSGYMSGETPSTITSKCSKYGYTCDSYPGRDRIFENWFGEYGMTCTTKTWDGNQQGMNEIVNHIKSEKPVILNITSNGTLVLNSGSSENYPNGHFVTLLGVDESGNIFVGDPWGADGWTSQENIMKSGTNGYYLVDKN